MNIPANRARLATRHNAGPDARAWGGPLMGARPIPTTTAPAPHDKARAVAGLLMVAMAAAIVGAAVVLAFPVFAHAIETAAAIRDALTF